MSLLYPEEDQLIRDPSDEEDRLRLATRRKYEDDPGSYSATPQISSRDDAGIYDNSEQAVPQERHKSGLSPEWLATKAKIDQLLQEQPQRKKPSVWGQIAAGAVGGAAGFSNADGRAPQIDPSRAINNLNGTTAFNNQTSDWKRRLSATQQQLQGQEDQRQAEQNQSTFNTGEEYKQEQMKRLRSQEARDQAIADKPTPVPGAPPGTMFDPKTRQTFLIKQPKVRPETIAPGHGIFNEATGKWDIPVPAADKPDPAAKEDPNHWIAVINNPESSASEREIAKANLALDTRLKGNIARAGAQARQDVASTPAAPIVPGSREFKVAQDLAYGKLTMQQFRSMTAYSRDVNKKFDIYNKASDLNPNFNPAQFEMGLTLAKNPKVQQQLASMDNVVQAVPDLIKASDAASRSGLTVLNKLILPGGVALGGKKYSNLATARTAFADELSGALGFGSATDMSREMGFNMTDTNLSPENFKAAIQDVVVPFIERKRSTMLHQMGVYGQPGMNPGAGETAPLPQGGGPKMGDIQQHLGHNYKFDGRQWVIQ